MSAKILALMYHRIAVSSADPWGLCVQPEFFEEQLQVLSTAFPVISLKELYVQLSAGSIKENAVCLTFDDGYADNYSAAMPLLSQHKCPATFFITTDAVGKQQRFWWDELGEIVLLSEKLPDYILFEIDHFRFEHMLGDAVISHDQCVRHKDWKYYQPHVSGRSRLFLKLWRLCLKLEVYQIETLILFLKKWADFKDPNRSLELPMTHQQLLYSADYTLCDLGIHTVTHPDLSNQSLTDQESEIANSKKFLLSYRNFSNVISYPYGKFNSDTIKALERYNIDMAFTTSQELITSCSDIKRLGRFQVFNWTGSMFEKKIKKWFSEKRTS